MRTACTLLFRGPVLAGSAKVGDKSVTNDDTRVGDWKVGDEIAIATSSIKDSIDHSENERRTITAIAIGENSATFSFAEPLLCTCTLSTTTTQSKWRTSAGQFGFMVVPPSLLDRKRREAQFASCADEEAQFWREDPSLQCRKQFARHLTDWLRCPCFDPMRDCANSRSRSLPMRRHKCSW